MPKSPEYKCEVCGKPIDCCFVGMGEKRYAHRHCYEKQNPPTPCYILREVARGHGDPVLAAEVICSLVPNELGLKIVGEFNRRLLMAWQRRCEG